MKKKKWDEDEDQDFGVRRKKSRSGDRNKLNEIARNLLVNNEDDLDDDEYDELYDYSSGYKK